jgi:hypothetical protein
MKWQQYIWAGYREWNFESDFIKVRISEVEESGITYPHASAGPKLFQVKVNNRSLDINKFPWEAPETFKSLRAAKKASKKVLKEFAKNLLTKLE